MANDVKAAETQASSLFWGYCWMLYFFLAIGVVGGIFAYALAIPLCLMGALFHPLWKWGGKTMCLGVDVLMRVQPWLNESISIQLPKGQTVVTFSNHRSHLDMFLLLARFPSLRVIAKRPLFNVPFLGVMMRVLKNIPLSKNNPDSYRKAFEKSLKVIQEGDHAHFFPEMTRCDPGFKGTQEFHLSPFQIMLKAGVPIVPIIFENTDEVWPKGSMSLRFRKQVRARSLDIIDPKDFKTADELRLHCKRILDAELARVQTKLTQLNLTESVKLNPNYAVS